MTVTLCWRSSRLVRDTAAAASAPNAATTTPTINAAINDIPGSAAAGLNRYLLLFLRRRLLRGSLGCRLPRGGFRCLRRHPSIPLSISRPGGRLTRGFIESGSNVGRFKSVHKRDFPVISIEHFDTSSKQGEALKEK